MRSDADLDYTVAELVDGPQFRSISLISFQFQFYIGALFNSGQSCCSIEVCSPFSIGVD